MPKASLYAKIGTPSADLEVIAERVVGKEDLTPEILAGLSASKPKVKFGCLKVLRLISERKPKVVYAYFNHFVDLLDHENNILKWGGIIILGNLARVDSEGRIERILDLYLAPIAGPAMITAANTIRGAGKIASAKPQLADKIARAILRVETAEYQTAECRNVALGHAIASIGLFFEHLREPEPVIYFVRRQLSNRRSSVKRKAAEFLKRHGP